MLADGLARYLDMGSYQTIAQNLNVDASTCGEQRTCLEIQGQWITSMQRSLKINSCA